MEKEPRTEGTGMSNGEDQTIFFKEVRSRNGSSKSRLLSVFGRRAYDLQTLLLEGQWTGQLCAPSYLNPSRRQDVEQSECSDYHISINAIAINSL
jgi:hypothetical protein